MEFQVVITKDGSTSIFVPVLHEHYHSVHGAVQESMHVFINNGLLALPSEARSVRIFEMGFGTGLNALLTLIASKESRQVDYHAIDTVALDEPVLEQMNYYKVLNNTQLQDVYRRMYLAPWQQITNIEKGFSLTKYLVPIQQARIPGNLDLVYFDAFSPDAQPECWTSEVFANLYDHMADGGILVTYSAKGSVRRTLQAVGFHVEKLPGPPGKREMIRAKKEN